MALFDQISALRSKAEEQLPLLNTEKKVQNALLLPFFATLGYNPFDVREVEPEFMVVLEEGGTRTLDYAVKKNRSPAMLFLYKEIGTDLDVSDPASLLRCIENSEAPIGALTDGVNYHFYANLEPFYAVLKGGTVADRRPFLKFDLFDHKDNEVKDIRRLTKSEFDADQILPEAHHLKYRRLFQEYLERQGKNPDQAFIRFLMNQVNEGESPPGDTGMYESPVRAALHQLMRSSGESRDRGSAQGETREGGAKEEPGSRGEDTLSKEGSDGGSGSSFSRKVREFFEQN